MATEIDLDEVALEKARASLAVAQESLSKAKRDVEENANEFSREGNDEIKEAARQAQIPSSKNWYNFWERASRIPKDEKYETCLGEKIKWKKITEKTQQEVLDVDGETEGWKSVSNRGGVKVEYSPDRSRDGTSYYRIKTTLSVPPRLVLLTQVRAPVSGQADESLIYMREHYNFVGGRTSLMHSVKRVIPYASFSLRDFFDLTHWEEHEDGTIVFSAQSIRALSAKLPNTVRGENVIYGFVLKPTKVKTGGFLGTGGSEVDGTDVTFVVQSRVNGWAPSFLVDWVTPSSLAGLLKSIEKAGKEIQNGGNAEKLIRKHVLRELDDE